MPKILGRFGAPVYFFLLICVSASCLMGAEPEVATGTKDSDVLATIGEVSITREKLNTEIKNLEAQNQQVANINMKQLLKEIVEMNLLEMEASKQPGQDAPEFKKRKKEISMAMVAQSCVKDLMDEAMKSEKDPKAATPAPEKPKVNSDRYHVQQITCKTMDEAAKAKKELDGGKSFLEIAKTSSTDSFKDNGGDRGFVALTEVTPQVASALAGLKVNTVSDPIQETPESVVLIKVSEIQAAPPSEEAPGRDKATEAKKAAFEKVIGEIKKGFDFKIDEAGLKLLEKPALAPEDLEKPLFTIGTETVKIAEIADDLEQIPAFLRPQILSGEGLKDFVNQFSYRMLIRKYVETNFDKLSQKYPAALALASREASIREFLNSKLKDVTATDEEIKDFYSKNVAQFTQAESSRAHHILVDSEEKAKAILDRLENKKEKFEDIAKAESKCPSGKEGGDLGSFEKGKMVPEFEAALEKAEPGKNIGPVKTQFGYHIVRLDERKPPHTAAVEEVKDQIKQQILPKKQKEAFETLVSDLRKKYPVKEFPEKL